tara:strand:- start:14161 stop:14391 length:231 start_codon:yes stop_codon:yes gene_type:complete
MNKSQRNAKAKAKGLRQARRKKKINIIKNKERKEHTLKGTNYNSGLYFAGDTNKYMSGVLKSSFRKGIRRTGSNSK